MKSFGSSCERGRKKESWNWKEEGGRRRKFLLLHCYTLHFTVLKGRERETTALT